MGLSLTFPIRLLLTRISSQRFMCNLGHLGCFHDPLGESLLSDVSPGNQRKTWEEVISKRTPDE